MKSFFINQYGNHEVIQFGEMLEPKVQDNDVLIRIHAASINPLDIRIREGSLEALLPYSFPLILGNDLAGVVVQVGAKVKNFKEGDEVYAKTDQDRIGAFAEFVSIKEDAVAIKPKKLTMEEAASVPLVGLAAWQVLIERAGLKKGQKVLIQAGSGGVGSFAIQLAKYLGATVATTTGTDNIEWVKNLGADVVIDYKKEKFEEILNNYDVVFDTLGGEVLEKSLKVLKAGGKVITLAGSPNPNFAKNKGFPQIDYSFLFMRPSGDQLREIGSLIDAGIVHPVVDRVFPFESTKEALAYVENGRAKGKVIVKVR